MLLGRFTWISGHERFVCAPTGTDRGVAIGPVTCIGDLGVATNAVGSIEDVFSIGNGGIGISATSLVRITNSLAL